MGNISNIFKGGFTPPPFDIDIPTDPEEQLCKAMLAQGITPPSAVYLDGALHRFPIGQKAGDDAGWYVAYADEIPAGSFGNWRTRESYNFKGDAGRPLTMMESIAIDKRIKDAQEARDRDREARARSAQDSVGTIWSTTEDAPQDHPYLVKKGVASHGLKITGDGRLMVPIYSAGGELVNLQYISTQGNKRYHSGADIKGCFSILGDPGSEIFVCEGYATAATVYQETGIATVVAFSAGNLDPVISHLRERSPMGKITIVADNDESQTGQEAASRAADLYGCTVVTPPILGDANDYAQAGGDLKALLLPPTPQWLQSANDLLTAPQPITWLIKHWVQSKAMAMLFGPSGSGKTFLALDWMLSIATGRPEWMGKKVKQGDVVYLCGEGHHGLRGRIAAWAQVHGVTDLSGMYVSKSSTDLDKPDGLRLAIQSITDLGVRPAVIAVDTLNRFLSGDENSAQDTKVFLDSCAALTQEFGCTILVVHHTGVAAEAQGRARGSSAWKGALDAEITVENNKGIMAVKQTKMKDAEAQEPLYMSLQSVPISGWYDEDGEQVTSAVVVVDAPPSEAPKANETKYTQSLKDAWRAGGIINADGDCFLAKDTWRDHLITEGMSKDSAYKAMRDEPSRMVGKLLEMGTIEAKGTGFIIADGALMSMLLIGRNSYV